MSSMLVSMDFGGRRKDNSPVRAVQIQHPEALRAAAECIAVHDHIGGVCHLLNINHLQASLL